MIATTDLTPQQERDLAQLAAYRERHTIEVVSEPGNHGDVDHRCEHDGIPVYPIRKGWRHDHDTIHRLVSRTAGLR